MTHWTVRAACATADPDAWFADTTDSDTVARAIAICMSCPVRLLCLDDAMRTEGNVGPASRHGIRGGLTRDDRWRLYDQQRPKVRRIKPATEPTAPDPADLQKAS